MAADLHIHVMENVDTDDLRCFNSRTLGSKYFNLHRRECDKLYDCEHYHRVLESPQVWIGEVSWLKAMLFTDGETYVPGAIEGVNTLVGEHEPTIDDEFIDKIRDVFTRINDTLYRIADVDEVVTFLEEHKGKKVFTVSW